MLDYILFGSIGLLLLVLIGFLIIVIRDHMKSKSFELYVRQTEEELELQAQTHRFEKPERVRRRQKESLQKEIRQRESETKPRQGENPAPTAKRTAESPTPPGTPEIRQPIFEFETETPRKENVHTEPQTFRSEMAETENPAESRSAAAESEKKPTVYPFPSQARPEQTEAQRRAKEILSKDYGHFSHRRLVEGMGLSPEEADEFVVELIGQLEASIDQLDELIEKGDYTEVEHVTHGLKGAALNIGEGGVAQLLIDYNTYMKEGNEKPIVEAYQTRLKETVSDLKVEYSQVA